MFSLFCYFQLFQEVHKNAVANVQEVHVCLPAHVDSYLDCFFSGHFGAKYLLLKYFAFPHFLSHVIQGGVLQRFLAAFL